jgi:hypothetical protein
VPERVEKFDRAYRAPVQAVRRVTRNMMSGTKRRSSLKKRDREEEEKHRTQRSISEAEVSGWLRESIIAQRDLSSQISRRAKRLRSKRPPPLCVHSSDRDATPLAMPFAIINILFTNASSNPLPP